MLATVIVSACAGMPGHVPAGISHVLRIADPSDPSSLDPLLAHDQDTIAYDLLVCQTLVGLDAQNRLTPLLVTRVPSRANGDVSTDGLRITYHLRRNVRFADGAPFTSADVAFTYRAILDSRNPVLSQDAYRRIVSLRTPDPHTVVIRLHHPWNAAVSELFAQSDFAFGILPAHAFPDTRLLHAAWEDHAFGTGPFRVVRWMRGDRIVLEPNPYFKPRPKLARIELRMIPDPNAAPVSLRSGDVDVAPIYPDQLVSIEGVRGLRVLETPENATIWITMQLSRPPANARNVRLAVAHAIDMATIRDVFHGLYPQAGSFLPPVLRPWHDRAIKPYAYDLRAARALLHGRTIDVQLAVENLGIFMRLATVLQEQLARAGIRATIKEFPIALYNAPDGPIRNARFTLTIDGWLGGADPEQSIIFLCSQANPDGDNSGRYCDPAFEALFRDQQRTRSPLRRLADFRAMQRLIHDRIAVIPLYYEVYFDGLSDRVRGFSRNMLRYPVSPEVWDVP